MAGVHDLEAEQAVLGALLCEPRESLYGLEASHFYDPVHAALFAQIQERAARGERGDGVGLRAWAEKRLAELGGVQYLMQLMEPQGVFRPFPNCVAAVREAHARRSALAALDAARGLIANGGDVAEALAESEAVIRAAMPDEARADTLAEAGVAMLGGLDTPLLRTRLGGLDERLGGLARGDLIILAGRPSMGKSAVAAQIGRNVASGGGGVHFASLEMSKEQVAARAVSAESRRAEYSAQHVPYFNIRAGRQVEREYLSELAARLPASMIVDDRPAQTLAQLEQSARASRRRLGRLDLIVVDYLQLMRAKRTDGRVNEVTEISQGLKAIAKRLQCPVLALSQLSRAVEGRECKRPTLADLRDSGAIEQDADAVLGVYREAYYLERSEPGEGEPDAWARWKAKLQAAENVLEIITLKQRSGPIGTDQFVAWLAFDTIKDRGRG